MIILIVVEDKNIKTGVSSLVVSHGYDTDADKNITMSQQHPSSLGGIFDMSIMEWVLPEKG